MNQYNINFKYSYKIDRYTFFLNLIHFLHIEFEYHLALVFNICFPFLNQDNFYMNIYTLFYCNLLIYFINNYKKLIVLDAILFITYLSNNNSNIIFTLFFYIICFSYITLITCTLILYYYINNNVFNYIKYYNYGKPIMKYINFNNNKTCVIHINTFFEDIVDIYHDCLSIG